MAVARRKGARAALLAGSMLAGLAGQSLAAEATRYTYDALGRVVSAVDSNGRTVVYAYDNAGNRTRLSNGVEFAEIIPVAFTASSNAGTSGLTTSGAMRDGQFGPLASIHVTNVETGAWILVDLGVAKSVNHIEVAAALALTLEAGPEDLNDTILQYSSDATTWRDAGAVSGVAVGATRTISLGGVSLRYLRLKRPNTSALAIGDLRLFSSAPPAGSPLIAEPDTITSTGSPVTFDPRVNDRDADGHTITITSVEDPPHGQATINAGASITYTPDPGYSGPDSFLYAIADGHDAAASARVSVTVRSASNNPPVAVPDSFPVLDRPTAAIEGLNDLRPLANDYDADGDVLSITGLSTPAHGQASVIGGGLVRYQPDVGYLGTETLTYTVSDGRGGTASGTITLAVANGPPIPGPDSASVEQNMPVSLNLLANDSDPNGDPLTITSVTAPTRGTATLNPDQTVTYTPNAGAAGADSFTYALSDGRGGQATGSVTLNIATTNAVELRVMEPTKYGSQVTITGRRFLALADRDNVYNIRAGANVYLTSPISTGKAYWEVKHLCGAIMPGITDNPIVARSHGGAFGYNAGIYPGSATWTPAGYTGNYAPQAANDVYGFALDADAKILKIYKNNALVSTLNLPFSGPYLPHSGSQTRADYNVISGQSCEAGDASGEFLFGPGTVYAPPTGYEAVRDQRSDRLSAVDDLIFVTANNPKTLDPRANDSGGAGAGITITGANQPNHGTTIVNSGASITYTPATGYVGLDSFSYTVSDNQGATGSAAVKVMVGAGSPSFTLDPPVSGKSTWNLAIDGPLNLATSGVWTIVPQNTFLAPLKTWGGGGGNRGTYGGGGGFVGAIVRFDAGQSYKLYVGGRGAGGAGGLNGGGGAGPHGAGGGGYSGLRMTAGAPILIAGGGGGSGYYEGGGGGAGNTPPEAGRANALAPGGVIYGGGAYQGGAGATGASAGGGGGGGGGYIGGGGGHVSANGYYNGSGAGGSGFIDASRAAAAAMSAAAGRIPGASTDLDRGTSGNSETAGRLMLGVAVAPAAPGGDPPSSPPGNLKPQTVSDVLYVVAGTTGTIDPRANDWDPNGDGLTIVSATGAAHGALAVSSGTSVSYTASPGYAGPDRFSYVVADPTGATSAGTVSVKVGAGYAFTISPAVGGKTTWDLEADGPLILATPGVWTITPQTSFTIPVKTWGAGGGGAPPGTGGKGGGGGYAAASVQFSAGATYKLYVGGGGSQSGTGEEVSGLNGGGTGYFGGGGYSGIRTNAGAGVLIAGGGGGGGGGGNAAPLTAGGGGGGATAENGVHTTRPALIGLAGAGGSYQGGAATASGAGLYAGGGGGGHVGGGGGTTSNSFYDSGGGGAGGSGYFDPNVTIGATLVTAVGETPANASDPDRGSSGSPQPKNSVATPPGRLLLLRGVNP